MVQTQKQRRKETELRKLTANLKGKWRSVQVHKCIVFYTLRSGVAIFNCGLHAFRCRLLVFTFYVSSLPLVLFLLSDSFFPFIIFSCSLSFCWIVFFGSCFLWYYFSSLHVCFVLVAALARSGVIRRRRLLHVFVLISYFLGRKKAKGKELKKLSMYHCRCFIMKFTVHKL